MELKHDGPIQFTEFTSRLAKSGKSVTRLWSEFAQFLTTPRRTSETFEQYKAMSKDKQCAVKDVGGFVGGELKDGRKIKTHILSRSLLALDADAAEADFFGTYKRAYGNAAVVYSTHKHTKTKPRLRLVLPLNRPVSPEEYEALCLILMCNLGDAQFDPCSREPARLMFYPSASKDADFYADFCDAPWLNPDLLLDELTDWHDISSWPEPPRLTQERVREAKKQGAAKDKPGIIGLFNQAYDIADAIETFLPDVYEKHPKLRDRWTYRPASTSGGLVSYENGTYAWSFHATDPAAGHLNSAFDLVRIHLFGARDLDCKDSTPMSRRPSFLAMQDLAQNDTRVKRALLADYKDPDAPDAQPTGPPEQPKRWTDALTLDGKGRIQSTRSNVCLILDNDPHFKGAIAYNEMMARPVVVNKLPWDKRVNKLSGSPWDQYDEEYLQQFLQDKFGIKSKQDVLGGMMITAKNHSFNPVRDYLDALPAWDGIERLDTLLVTYLGAEDSPYTRAVTRKTFTAAVARIYAPGTKFDCMLILSGPQGRGKSTLAEKMARGFHTSSVSGIGSKEAYESIQGYWLIEMAELAALNKKDIEPIKNFISQRIDSYRTPYARWTEDHPRMCIFIGTTNSRAVLRDPSGNRRFWPVACENEPEDHVWNMTDYELDQLWAEAKARYKAHEPLFLPEDIERTAREIQEEFTEDDPLVGEIAEFLNIPLPSDWNGRDKYARRLWLNTRDRDDGSVKRMTICAAEIWYELFQREGSPPNQEARRINDALARIPGWTREPKKRRVPSYGIQKCYRRICTNTSNEPESASPENLPNF